MGLKLSTAICRAAKQYGETHGSYANRDCINDNAMIAEMEYGYWVGTSIYVSKENVLKWLDENGYERTAL